MKVQYLNIWWALVVKKALNRAPIRQNLENLHLRNIPVLQGSRRKILVSTPDFQNLGMTWLCESFGTIIWPPGSPGEDLTSAPLNVMFVWRRWYWTWSHSPCPGCCSGRPSPNPRTEPQPTAASCDEKSVKRSHHDLSNYEIIPCLKVPFFWKQIWFILCHLCDF